MSDPDPRDTAAAVGRALGEGEVAEDILSGRMSAKEVAPLVAGILRGALFEVALPIVSGEVVDDFGLGVDPWACDIRLVDGSTLTVRVQGDR